MQIAGIWVEDLEFNRVPGSVKEYVRSLFLRTTSDWELAPGSTFMLGSDTLIIKVDVKNLPVNCNEHDEKMFRYVMLGEVTDPVGLKFGRAKYSRTLVVTINKVRQ